MLSLAALCYPMAAARAGSPEPSSVRIHEKITRYAIAADSIDELRTQLQHDIPALDDANGAHGRTSSDIRIAYDLERTDKGCRLRDLQVRLDIEVTLPDWRPDKAPPKRQRERWSSALAALERHEATHRANARAAAEETRSRILDIGLQPDCRTVRNMANRRLRRAVLKYEFRDRRYDARTRNGAEQGAVL
jgi:predicted secreted Zn-dependent protease